MDRPYGDTAEADNFPADRHHLLASFIPPHEGLSYLLGNGI
jgi:hypothetical protein